ncbi:hypothetical protein [Helicobacter sp. T3_23-1059]
MKSSNTKSKILAKQEKSIIIASEQRERGNPQSAKCNTNNICHTEGVARSIQNEIDCHADFVKSDRDDSNICHTERSEVSLKNIDCHELDSAKIQNLIARNNTHPQTPSAREGAYFGLPRVASNARNDGIISTSIAELQTSYSPSLAEGARGWVSLDSTAVIVSNDKKNPSLRALQRNAWQSTTKNATNDSSVADFAKADIANTDSSVTSLAKAKSNNANFASAKSTHPQTPSAREGALRSVATLSRDGVFISNATTNICHTERSEVSLKNIDCHDFATFNKAANSRNGGIIFPSLADLQTSYSPSLAEGARGWVSLDSTAVIVSNDKKNPSLRALQRNAWQSTTKNATNDSSIANFSKVDIVNTDSNVASLANAKSNNANFASAKSTHPQTPSAREGASSARERALKNIANATNCHTEALAEVSQNAQINRDISGFALNMTKGNDMTKKNNTTKGI